MSSPAMCCPKCFRVLEYDEKHVDYPCYHCETAFDVTHLIPAPKQNAGITCDMEDGPCACGAWHESDPSVGGNSGYPGIKAIPSVYNGKSAEEWYTLYCKASFVTKATGTEHEVCLDIAKRQQKGINKYGGTVADNPLVLKEWLQHAYEECLDQAVYLRRAIEEITKLNE